MKWLFYVIVFVYMFYRAVYGAKVKDVQSLSIEPSIGAVAERFLNVGDRKIFNCKGSSKHQKLEWINPIGLVVPRQENNRVFATQYSVKSPRSSGSSLVLTFDHAAVEDTGVWQCRSGDQVQEVPVCVIDSTDFNGTPVEVSADENRAYTLSCQVKGDPEPIIIWSRNEHEIDDDESSTPKYKITRKYNSQGFEGLLTIMSLTPEDGGVYTCSAVQESPLVENCGYVEHFNITLNINRIPSFEEKDAREKIYGEVDESLFIKCEADGYPEPTYRWFRKTDNNVYEFTEKEITYPDNSSAILQVKVTEDTYNEEYVCRATNKLGDVEKHFSILEPIKPETPSDLEPIFSTSTSIVCNVTWEAEILFDIHEVEVQYLPTAHLARKKHSTPKESDWKTAKRSMASIGDIRDYSALVELGGLQESTEYWVRLRIKNDVGATPWSEAIKVSTEQSDKKSEEDEDKESDEEGSEEETEANETEDDSLITTESTSESSEQRPDDSGKFYGLFFAVGVLLLVVGCTFIMRLVK